MRYLLSLGFALGLLLISFTLKKDTTLNGKVVDKKGQPVAGATVMVKGTLVSALTDTGGNFKIVVPSGRNILVVQVAGYETREVKLSSGKVLRIVLNQRSPALDDVVVSGYTAQEKKSIARLPGAESVPTYQQQPPDGSTSDFEPEQLPDDNGNGWRYNNDFNREGYDKISENPFLKVDDNPLSTFSIDVDAASYSNVRRFINRGQLPPPGAVRIEEMINYFSYHYTEPANDEPFAVHMELSGCPWNSQHRMVLIGLQGKHIPVTQLPAANLVFLIDVSGSMDEADKLPLVKQSLALLVDQLRADDRVALVVYAGNAGLVLPPTPGSEKTRIKDAIARLEAGGSTAGGAGIQLAYNVAKEHFVHDGNNRVILCTDGDFNVGLSSDDALENLIERERKSGIYLTVLGFGTGNYQDAKMQKLADKGNGNHDYIDGISEAKKVLVHEFGGTLFTIAKDVKLQVEFNPEHVKAYRLIGYENRLLAKEDFNNDRKDAGELGSGHTVTALYEIIPSGVSDESLDSVDPLRYQKAKRVRTPDTLKDELLNVKLRFKQPRDEYDSARSRLLQFPLVDRAEELSKSSDNFRFAAAVAAYGLLLRNSAYKGDAGFPMVERLAKGACGTDVEGYRAEFVRMVQRTALLTTGETTGRSGMSY